MEGSRNRLIRAITERTMVKITDRQKLDIPTFNIIYEEVKKALEIMKDSLDSGGR